MGMMKWLSQRRSWVTCSPQLCRNFVVFWVVIGCILMVDLW